MDIIRREYNKLVRDLVPDVIISNGGIPVTEELTEEQYRQALDVKLLEKVTEFLEDDNVYEIADILEVIYAIIEVKGLTMAEVETVRAEKAKERGAFRKRIFLKEVR